ncbi:hypothetical protein KC357_g15 [Hortaea werneckii]|nr:hypothetical protein KC357_g15 [Hortaea werneckii]
MTESALKLCRTTQGGGRWEEEQRKKTSLERRKAEKCSIVATAPVRRRPSTLNEALQVTEQHYRCESLMRKSNLESNNGKTCFFSKKLTPAGYPDFAFQEDEEEVEEEKSLKNIRSASSLQGGEQVRYYKLPYRFDDSFQASLERLINQIGELLAVLKVESAIAPDRAQVLEGGALKLGRFGLDKLNVVSDQTVADRIMANCGSGSGTRTGRVPPDRTGKCR